VLEAAPLGSRWALGGDNVSLRDFYALVRELSGARIPSLRLPTPLAKGVGAAMRGVAKLTGGVPQLTPDLVEVCLHDWALDSSRAERELGYRRRSLREGLQQTLDWLGETRLWQR
jgi:nucleoside-diphosphate-sugar epimerase